MNEAIIERWNATVKDEDIVYHLGDVIMGEDLEAGLRLIQKLKGQKYLAFGNHETDNRLKAFAANHLFKEIQMGYRLKVRKMIFVATHYPTVVNNNDKTPIYNIHGHTHSINKISNLTKCYNVNVEAWNCTPVNLEDIKKDIKENSKIFWT